MGKKTKSTSGYNKTALPYIQQAAGAVQSAYSGNQGNLANINNTLQSNMGQVVNSTLNDPGLAAAGSYNNDVLGGKFLGSGNPYLSQIISDTNSSVADTVNGAVGTRGLTGGSAQQQILARELAKNETSLRAGEYDKERGYQQAAVGNAATLSNSNDNNIQALLAYLGTQATLPTAGADDYANQMRNLWSGNTTSTTSQGLGSSLASIAGAGLSGWASGGFKMASDRRLKTNIRKVGEMSDGLGVYRYTYKAGGPERTGVMADEVARFRPWALGPTIEGVATVDYGAL